MCLKSINLVRNGLEVDCTDNGNDACRLVDQNHYDCIVLDIMMPGKNGREVCKYIRNKYDVPVIFLTALSRCVCSEAPATYLLCGGCLGLNACELYPFPPCDGYKTSVSS